MQLGLKRLFCASNASEPISNSFKSKARYKDFIKQIHPDVIFTAPEKVREENLRSQKRLNTYLENLKKNSGTDHVLLKFYCPEKTTVKAKKYYYFEVKQNKLHAMANNTIKENLINQTYDRLANSLSEVRLEHDPLEKKQKKNEREDIHETISILGAKNNLPFEQQNPDLRFKDSKKREDYQKESGMLNQILRNYEANMTKDKIYDMLNKEQFFYEKGLSHKKQFAKDIIENLDFVKADQVLVSSFLDPKFFYVSEEITDEMQLEFHDNLEQSQEKSFDKITLLTKIMDMLESANPDVKILVKDGWGSDIPGFIGIDYKCNFETFLEYIRDNLPKVTSEKKIYLNQLENINDIKEKLLKNFQILEIKLPDIKNNLEHMELFMTRLAKHVLELVDLKDPKIIRKLKVLRLSMVENTQDALVSKLRVEKNMIYQKWNFDNNEFVEYIKSISK